MEKAIVVRLKKGKRTFEVLTHHGKVATWSDGKD
jgi:ribosome maturation protein Sdo1